MPTCRSDRVGLSWALAQSGSPWACAEEDRTALLSRLRHTIDDVGRWDRRLAGRFAPTGETPVDSLRPARRRSHPEMLVSPERPVPLPLPFPPDSFTKRVSEGWTA